MSKLKLNFVLKIANIKIFNKFKKNRNFEQKVLTQDKVSLIRHMRFS